MTIHGPEAAEPKPCKGPFFQKVDWLGFGFTTFVALTVYLLTAAPQVTLGYSGIFATAGVYASPSMPSGHPVWAIYGWLFVKLIPFSNIAWRLGVASATAGALTCGLVALMVSRVGLLMAQTIPNFRTFSAREQAACQLVCGAVAGLGLGLDGGFWGKTVVADTWPLGVFLFTMTVCLLCRWFFSPNLRRYLYCAAFLHGLTLSETQALVPATFAFPLFLV